MARHAHEAFLRTQRARPATVVDRVLGLLLGHAGSDFVFVPRRLPRAHSGLNDKTASLRICKEVRARREELTT